MKSPHRNLELAPLYLSLYGTPGSWSTNQGHPKPQSSFSSCAERLLSESVSNSSTSSHNIVYEPGLVDHQLIGDSQFCRFGEQLLGLRRVPTPNSSGRIGICVSGQTISDLHKRVKEKFYPISNKIILMIGTNDFLKDADISTMCGELSALIKTLQETVTSIILLTLPPIPKLEKKYGPSHFKLLEKYNSHIRSLENEDCVRIADIFPLYVSSSPRQKCHIHLFERSISNKTELFPRSRDWAASTTVNYGRLPCTTLYISTEQ
ncbi:hypothetical protein J6590_099594 [Homalodisca vitripennis]|nr:hypothetical protein J6590_099594 [Homalodisca vitripennis]